MTNDIMAVGWDELDDLGSYPSREAIRQALDVEGSGGSMRNDVLALWEFHNEIAIGDIVYAKRGRREIVGRGEVTSDARFESDRASFRHVRSVKWTHYLVRRVSREPLKRSIQDWGRGAITHLDLLPPGPVIISGIAPVALEAGVWRPVSDTESCWPRSRHQNTYRSNSCRKAQLMATY
ncbi:hypothetical protein [Paenarthrobacter sp. NEAU-H11]|uniref:hypothetical protein n=1 Tax=Paenarthrobacter sp. NEAU-H11 TaxID=3423924 RepID=UPI003D3547D7